MVASLTPPCRVILNQRNLDSPRPATSGRSRGRRHPSFLNNDLVLLPGWLEPMLDILARNRSSASSATGRTGS